MKFKLDENLPAEAASCLIAGGHEVETVLDEKMGGAKDVTIASVCRAEGRALITLDWHFADIRNYPPADYPGIVVLNPPGQDKTTVCTFVARIPALVEREVVAGKLWILEEKRLRVRG